MRGFVRFLSLCMCIVSWGAFAQISNFNLTVTKTDETCQGNGTLNFSVSNTSANAQILYKIYKLPNTTSAMSIQTSTYIGGLTAGTYKIVAIQSLNNASNSKEQQITLSKNIVSFAFSVTTQQANCSTGGSLVLNATSGTLSGCEIISGPVTRPRQASNIFTNLPTGTYYIRAYNECGIGKVKAYTLNVVSASLEIGDTAYVSDPSMACDSIQISNSISSTSGAINYPLTVKHVLYPMDLSGQSLVYEQNFATGDANTLTVTARVPRFLTDAYAYDLTVTDFCGNLYSKTDNVVDPGIGMLLSAGDALCAQKFLNINVTKFTGSYSVAFLSAPSEFNPADFLATPAGPFTAATTTYGSATAPLPFGIYVVQVTDSCGRTVTDTIELEFILPRPSYSASITECFSDYGTITANVLPQNIVSVTLIEAPAEYTQAHTLPEDVSAFISNGRFRMTNMPKGWYKIQISDDCGFTYPAQRIEMKDYVDKSFNIATLPSCGPGFGGVRFRSGNSAVLTAKIISAPSSFEHALPYDLSASLTSGGYIYVDNLPEGDYIFDGLDTCGATKQLPVTVVGYNIDTTPYEFTAVCGTFSVKVTDDSNGTEGATYWLQRYNSDTNTWGHPQTGVVYIDGTDPTTANGIKLSNNSQRNNLAYSGKFRIMKKFETFTNASSENVLCISQLGDTFEYYEGLSINAIYTMACAGSPREVIIDYTGTASAFRIIQKNGQPFVLENGSSNVFHDLEPAEYVFELEDTCGNLLPQWYQSADMPSMADAQDPTDLIECAEAGASLINRTFRLRDKDTEVLGPLYGSMYTITYHLTEVDAEAGINSLPDYITNSENGQQIWVRLQHNQINLCHKVTSFRLYVGEQQLASIETNGVICNDSATVLVAPAGYDAYVWSNGQTSQAIFVSEPGTYTVEVRRTYGTSYCSATATAEIIKSTTAKITNIEIGDWTYDHNTITINVEGTGDYEYSIDGSNFTASNTFDGLESGLYNVTVKDINGCGIATQEVVLLNYPKFFTPNGDGNNDKWKIKYSFKEPDFHVTIFDRYGKLITTLSSSSDGWDGTLNGIQLPSTDYWFVVNREDGRELRGHFSMVR